MPGFNIHQTKTAIKTVLDELLMQGETLPSPLVRRNCNCVQTRPISPNSPYLPKLPAKSGELEWESTFDPGIFPAEVRALLARGLEISAIQEAIRQNWQDENQLASLFFHARHPERKGRALSNRTEPKYNVPPCVQRFFTGAKGLHSLDGRAGGRVVSLVQKDIERLFLGQQLVFKQREGLFQSIFNHRPHRQ